MYVVAINGECIWQTTIITIGLPFGGNHDFTYFLWVRGGGGS